MITVAAQTTRQLLYLAVPVHRTERGFLVVPRYPALVGPPVSDPGAAPAEERDVSDGALRAVAERAVTNYLAGQRANLLADLDPAAVVSLPPALLDVRSVRSITKARATGSRSRSAPRTTRHPVDAALRAEGRAPRPLVRTRDRARSRRGRGRP